MFQSKSACGVISLPGQLFYSLGILLEVSFRNITPEMGKNSTKMVAIIPGSVVTLRLDSRP